MEYKINYENLLGKGGKVHDISDLADLVIDTRKMIRAIFYLLEVKEFSLNEEEYKKMDMKVK